MGTNTVMDTGMGVDVKICGIITPAIMTAALDAGADYVGLVFFPKSPRHVDLTTAAKLAEMASGTADVVALMVDPTDAQVAEIATQIGPDVIQLHGSETPERVAEVRQSSGARVMKAIAVASAADAARAHDYAEASDLILFDAKPPTGSDLPGGNGVGFDWSLLDAVRGEVDYMLSGGLTPETVADAIAATGCGAVDVSSGVESAPGVKDADLIRAFIAAAAHPGAER
ncbi:MAG: phosphoribosylanthranilate isomerase [Pseudomonadota bacterium]